MKTRLAESRFHRMLIAVVALIVEICVPHAAEPSAKVVERREHENVVETIYSMTDPSGNTWARTNRYVDLQPGQNIQDGDGKWVEADDTFNIDPTIDGAVSRRTRHKVTLPGDLNTIGGIQVRLPDGRVLRSHVYGLAYYDTSSGKSVLLAAVKDCKGWLDGERSVIYKDAFDELEADVRYTLNKGGFEQDIILRGAPPTPENYGLNPTTSRLEVWTKFLDAPEPEKAPKLTNQEGVQARGEAPLIDEDLSFQSMRMTTGKSFWEGQSDPALSFVAKEWLTTTAGGHFLVETVQLSAVSDALKELPASKGGASLRKPINGRLMSANDQVPQRKYKRSQAIPIQRQETIVAKTSPKGLVIDYSMVNTATDFVFASGTTYRVSGPVVLSGTNTTFQPGVVVKFDPTGNSKITISSPVTCLGEQYRPIVFTGRNDPTVGEWLTSNPISEYTYYSNIGIEFTHTGSPLKLRNMRFVRSQTAVSLPATSGHEITHVQFVDCGTGVLATGGGGYSLFNVLFRNMQNCLSKTSGAGTVSVQAEHVSVNTANWFNDSSGMTVTLVNSLLGGVTNLGSYTPTSVGTGAVATIFQSVGAGSSYLPPSSSHLNSGVTNINSTLLKDIKKRTVFAPTINTNVYTANTTLSQVSIRDNDAQPDRGYHYDPIDYAIQKLTVSNSTLLNPFSDSLRACICSPLPVSVFGVLP